MNSFSQPARPASTGVRIAGLMSVTALVLAACAGSGSSTTAPTTAAATTAPATSAASPAAESPGASGGEAEAYEVKLADNATLGKLLTGEDGKTLYLFTPDTTSASNCNGDCATAWPPFVLEGSETVTGAEGVTGTFGSVTRHDGGKQVTYAGHPLYYFSGDQAAGDVNGQGLNTKWYVVGADGNAIMGPASSSGGKGTY